MLCYRGGDCEVAYVMPGFDGLTLLDGVWCCSGITAEDPCNEHGTIYAISSDFGDRMTTQHLD